jgi:hypothetical protein
MSDEYTRTAGDQSESTGEADSAVARFASDIAGVLVTPVETMRSIGERQAVVPALVVVLLVVGISTGVQAIMLLMHVSPFAGPDPAVPGFILGIQLTNLLWNLVWVPVAWTITAGMLFGIAWLLGGRGQFMSLWATSGFAWLPSLLITPILAGHELVGMVSGGLQLLSLLIVIPVSIGAFVWYLALLTIAIRETMAVTTGRAVGVIALYFAVLVMIAVLILCIVLLIAAAIFGLAVA